MMAIYWPTLLWAKPDRQDTRSESDPPDRRDWPQFGRAKGAQLGGDVWWSLSRFRWIAKSASTRLAMVGRKRFEQECSTGVLQLEPCAQGSGRSVRPRAIRRPGKRPMGWKLPAFAFPVIVRRTAATCDRKCRL